MNNTIRAEPKISRRNVRGKKTRNPGYEVNNHWNICDLCGCAIRAKDTRMTWDGLAVCPDDWDYRHPQDFVRGRSDNTQPVGPSRPDLPEPPLPIVCVSIAIAGIAVAGCAKAGSIKDTLPIPAGTFNNDL